MASPGRMELQGKRATSALDGGWGWMVVLGSALTHFLIVGMGRSFGIIYLVLLDMYQGTAAQTAWVVALFNLMRMVLGPLAGVLCDRFTCRKVVFVGSLLLSLGCTISALSNSLLYLYFSFGVLAGLGGCMIFTPSYVIVGQYFDKKKAKAMAVSTLGSGLGTVALAPLITLFLHHYSYFGAMLILGALMLNNLVAAALFRPLHHNRPRPSKEQEVLEDACQDSKGKNSIPTECNVEPVTTYSEKDNLPIEIEMKIVEQDGSLCDTETKAQQETQSLCNAGGMPEDTSVHIRKPSRFRSFMKYFSILRNITFLLYGLQIITMSICIQTFLSFLPALAKQYGAKDARASFLLSIVGIADMVGRFLFGVIFDLRSIRYRRRVFHAILGIPVGVLAVLTGFAPGYYRILAVTIAFGLVEGGFHGQRATVISEFVTKEEMSHTVGFMIFFQGLGNILGPPVAGGLRDRFKNYNVCYYFSGTCLVVTSIIFLLECLRQLMCRNKDVAKKPAPE